jgi:hypothetical protein
MKKELKVYLTNETESQLKKKAKEFGFEGRGWLTHFLEKLAPLDFAILDNNLKKILNLINTK